MKNKVNSKEENNKDQNRNKEITRDYKENRKDQ